MRDAIFVRIRPAPGVGGDPARAVGNCGGAIQEELAQLDGAGPKDISGFILGTGSQIRLPGASDVKLDILDFSLPAHTTGP